MDEFSLARESCRFDTKYSRWWKGRRSSGSCIFALNGAAMEEEEENPPALPLVRQHGVSPSQRKETCVATVAIQSGQSRIVIAVLRVCINIVTSFSSV